jgi:hypothetical protein
MSPGFYKHNASMDVVFEVYWATSTPTAQVITGRWWNLGYTGKPWPLDEARITILKKHATNWTYMGEECPLRKGS